MSKKKKFLTVYTASSTERGPNGIDHHVVSGTFLNRGDAIRECAKDIMLTVKARQEMRSLFMEDARVRKALMEAGMPEGLIDGLGRASIDADNAMDKAVSFFEFNDANQNKAADALKDLLVDVIGGESFMTFRSDLVEFRFDVDENDVVSEEGMQVWTCVTSGIDDENHDPEFEQAYPQVFLGENEAVWCAIDDLMQYLDGYEEDEKNTIADEARERIAENGHFEFDLNDSKTRRWDVWSTPIDIGQGYGKVQMP